MLFFPTKYSNLIIQVSWLKNQGKIEIKSFFYIKMDFSNNIEIYKLLNLINNKINYGHFIISELKTAFQIGFLIYIPFLILDMVVASILLSMGMMMLPPVLISLPFKLMLFVMVDGWYLTVGSLMKSFS